LRQSGVPVVGRVCVHAVQPVAAVTLIAGPGAMMSATMVSLSVPAIPSSVSWPLESELMDVLVPVYPQPGDTTYHRGSPDTSVSLSRPSVRHGRRPTFGKLQLEATLPSFAVSSKYAAASGQGSAPGLFSPAFTACAAT